MGIQQLLDDFNIYLENNTSLAYASKKKYYRIVRLYLLDNMELNKGIIRISKDDMNRFITSKTSGNKRGHNTKAALAHFCISIGKKHWNQDFKKLKKKKPIKNFPYFKPEVMNKIINSLPMPYKGIAFFSGKGGVRFREAATIKIEDIDFQTDDKLIFIKVHEFAKGSKRRIVPFQRKWEYAISGFIKDKNYGFLFIDNKYNKVSDKIIHTYLDKLQARYNKLLAKIGKELDILGLSSHYPRHHFADHFMTLPNADIYVLQQILGHSDIKTTLDYLSIGISNVKNYLKRDDVDL